MGAVGQESRILEIIRDLARARSLEDVRASIRSRTRGLIGADGVAIVLREGDFVRYVDEDAVGPLWLGQHFPITGCISGVAIRNHEPVIIENIYDDHRIPVAAYEDTFVKSLAMVPIRPADPIGAIGVYWAARHRATESEIDLLQTLADAAAVAFENARLLEGLRREKSFSEGVIDSLPGLFYLLDEAGALVRWNRNVEEVSGYSAGEIAQMRPADFFDDREADALQEAISRGFRDGRASVELHLKTKTGGLVPHYFTGLRVILEDRPHLVGVGLDMQERLALEEQLRQAQKLEAVGRLAGGVAHDFNNLLTVMSSYSELALLQARRQQPVDPEMLEGIRAAASRGGQLTRQLLAFSRKQPLEAASQHLGGLVQEMAPLLQRLVGEHIELEVDLAADVGTVYADRTQLEQILLNLVVNAADAMPTGGRLTIRTARTSIDGRRVEQQLEAPAGDYVVLVVTDTGHGMDEATLDRIFEPFFTTKELGKGTGIGLATVYGIVRQHAGFITVDSSPGQGATFRVHLPRESAPTPAHPEPSALEPAPEAPAGATVLLVEDEALIRRVVAHLLTIHGYHVLSASHGDEAMEVTRDQDVRVDLLLTDVVMPGLSGREVYERLLPRWPKLKVVYMSGYPGEALAPYDVDFAEETLLNKPFSGPELLATVRRSLTE